MAETITTAEPIPEGKYELIGFVIVGNELKATVRIPNGDVYQGTVGQWRRVAPIEVKQ